jgi:SAM-dependent methyltransferase
MSQGAAICQECKSSYAVTQGVPILVTSGEAINHDELDHHRTGPQESHSSRQAAWFDRPLSEEFEIIRPRGAPALYGWLLGEKVGMAVSPIGGNLAGLVAVVVCGGSGMDAEFLSERGAAVITTDISLGAALRAQQRARRFGIRLLSVVAAAERLPLNDRAVDLAYVHDGLHHLDHPDAALQEMARVARRWVAVTEPARATATGLAVRLGWAVDREEAGNRVVRFEPRILAQRLQTAGLRPVKADRYAMYYHHRPGAIFDFLSRPAIMPTVTAAWRIANRLVGRMGNKVVVVARRD